MLFPPEQLQLILQLTNSKLAMVRKNYTTAGQIVKFFGVILLVTRFEFGFQASLWSNTSTNNVVINRKPENSCEIQNGACEHSGVIIQLKVVKTAEEEDYSAVTDDDGNNHGTNVLKFLVEP